jgi:hypothetical protein
MITGQRDLFDSLNAGVLVFTRQTGVLPVVAKHLMVGWLQVQVNAGAAAARVAAHRHSACCQYINTQELAVVHRVVIRPTIIQLIQLAGL